jgi:hypothetical protein
LAAWWCHSTNCPTLLQQLPNAFLRERWPMFYVMHLSAKLTAPELHGLFWEFGQY